MKKLIITILALVVLSLALSAQMVFKDSKDSRHPDVSGHIYIYSESQHAWVVDTESSHQIIIYLYIDENSTSTQNYPELIMCHGYYEHSFDPYPDFSYCHYVVVECDNVDHPSEYIDGINNIVDIYIGHGPYPTPDNTIPAEQ